MRQRISSALIASFKHLGLSALIALLCAGLVFWLWYPHPYDELVGGRDLFLLVVTVDVISGPLLTFVVFNPQKPRFELVRDIGIIVVLQLAALAYGIYSVVEARPVFLSYEGNRFRVVTLPDVELASLDQARPEFQTFSLTGPKLIASRLSKGADPDFRESIQLSLQGTPPSFRPSRWLPFDQSIPDVLAEAKPLAALAQEDAAKKRLIDVELKQIGASADDVLFLPLEAGSRSDWVVLLDKSSAQPVGFLPIDGW